MYTCTMCGLKKTEVGSNPEFEFRSRRRMDEEAYIEGISDWCTKCEALRFFIKASEMKEPAQYLEEQQPKREHTNYVLEAKANSWQEKSRSKPRSGRRGREMSSSPNRKKSRDARHEVHKMMRQDLLANLSSQLPRGSLWDHKVRSCSEDRNRRSHHAHPGIEQRSKSVIHEPLDKPRMFTPQAEEHSDLAKDMFKLGFPQPVKRVQLDEHSDPDEDELRNDFDMPLNAADEDDERAPIRYKNKRPIGKLQQLELVNPWQEEVQRRTNQMMASSIKKEQHSSRNRQKDASVPKTPNIDEAGRYLDFAGGLNKDALVEELLNDMQGLEPTEQDDQLTKKLLEKKQLVSEWERIRLRVENECDRVKVELEELKHQRKKDAKRSKRDSPSTIERQRGGAQIGPQHAKSSHSSDLAIDRKNSNEKTIGDALDEKLETMLETLRECSQTAEVEEDELDEPQLFEPTAPLPSQLNVIESANQCYIDEDDTEEELPELGQMNEQSEPSDIDSSKPKHLLSKLHMLVSTVQRARFRGFPDDPQELLQNLNTAELMKHRDPPAAQFSTLPCSPNELISLLSMKRDVLEPNVARPLKVCRSPIFCPDADCRRMFFISDFNDHLTHEHPSLAMERITPSKAKTFFLDTRVTLLNKAKCNMVYFVKDKFFDENTDKFPDLLPVLVMSARLQAPEFFGTHDRPIQMPACSAGPDHEIFLIWLTSIRPDDVKIVGTLSVWPTSSQPIVEYLMVHTNEVYNIRSAQKLKHIYNSNRVMALPGSLVNRMTDGGKSLLAVQVLIH